MRFTINDLAQIASEPTPFLLDGLIPQNSFGILVGEWGLGKSPFALQMQLSLAAGLPFLGQYKTKPAKVLYVDLENGANSVLNIILNISKHLDLRETPNTMSVYSPNYGVKEEGLQTMREDLYINKLIQDEEIDFVVIDPLRMYLPGAESKNSEAAAMIRNFRKIIMKRNCTIMCIHHPRKISADPTVQRHHLDQNPTEWMSNACGAGALIQNADFRIGLEKDDDGFVIMRSFLRNKGWSDTKYIDTAYDEGDITMPLGYVVADRDKQIKPMDRNWLNALGNQFTNTEACAVLQKGRRQVYDWLHRLNRLGVIRAIGRGQWARVE